MAVLLGGLPAAAETGSVVEYLVPTMNSQPLSIVAAPDGNLWFTEFRGARRRGLVRRVRRKQIGRLDMKTVGRPIAPGVRSDDAPPVDPIQIGE